MHYFFTLLFTMALMSSYTAFGQSPFSAPSYRKGIFITQKTVEDSKKFYEIITQAKLSGINTFVVDFYQYSPIYQRNIALLKEWGIRYVARIIVFPYGGESKQVNSPEYLKMRYEQVSKAIELGADEIQLDYIRYTPKRRASSQNAKDIHHVIKWFKNRLHLAQIPLQVDVFGVVSFGPSLRIGQDLQVFAPSIDAACPMLYPSHFEPYRKHAKDPYVIISQALNALKKQFDNNPPFKVYPFIEMFNYRVKLSHTQRRKYIKAQIKAVEDSQVDGWYAWSAGNKYELLFEILQTKEVKGPNLSLEP